MLTIEIAGLTVGIHHLYPYLVKHCDGYLSEKNPDFTVTVTEAMIEEERKRGEFVTGRNTPTPGYLESIAAAREIARFLPNFSAFLFHAAVIEVDGEAVAFTATSGTGKSTHIKNWFHVFGDRVGIVNGDKPILRFGEVGKLYAYGTPWAGKEGWNRNIGVPMKALVLLQRGPENKIFKMTPEEAVNPLLNDSILLGAEPETIVATMDLIDRMLSSVSLFRLECTPAPESAEVAYRGIFQ